jgi:hypothetical protein
MPSERALYRDKLIIHTPERVLQFENEIMQMACGVHDLWTGGALSSWFSAAYGLPNLKTVKSKDRPCVNRDLFRI